MADEKRGAGGSASDGEARAAWTAVQWRDHKVALRAAADDADCSSDTLLELVNEVTCSLLAGAPPDGVANEAAVGCINAIIDALCARPSGDAPLRAAVTAALHTVTKSRTQSARSALFQAAAGALVGMLDQYSLDEPAQILDAVCVLFSYVHARIEGGSNGEQLLCRVPAGFATAAAAALARTCVRYVAVAEVSDTLLGTLLLLLKGAGDDKAAMQRAVLDASLSFPRWLLSGLTSFGKAHSNSRHMYAAHKAALLLLLGSGAEVSALLRAEPGAATGEATSLRAAVRALRASASGSAVHMHEALSAAESLVFMFMGTPEELKAAQAQARRADVLSGVLDFRIEVLIARGCADTDLCSHVLCVLQAIADDESESIVREAVTQAAVNAVFAVLRAHAATMDRDTAGPLCSYLLNAAHRFGRRPNGAGKTPAINAGISLYAAASRAH